ncbi:MAG: cation-translocating P-type ATPase [Candidatus Woesearchaeota archaeon]
MKEFYSEKIESVFDYLKSSKNGLTDKEVEKRINEYGYNELVELKKTSLLKMFLDQFANWLVILLVIAGFLSLIVGDIKESIAIFVIILLNTILGFIQEYKTDKAIKALENMTAPNAKVIRNEKEYIVPAKEIVPGDIVLLEAGDVVPADIRLIESNELKVDQAILTGESVASEKKVCILKKETSVDEQVNMVFSGTIVTYGKAKGIVVSTGMKTELGKIAETIQKTEETETPLQKKFEVLSKQIGIICLVLVAMVFFLGLYESIPLAEIMIVSLTLIVSTVPNSLPLVVTLGLTLGSQRLAKQNMLVKRLPAAESLGSVTYICTDKTGTLTKNEMTVTNIFLDNKDIQITGSGYKPEGDFLYNNKKISPKEIRNILKIGFLCNNSKLTKENNNYKIKGDPTEGSLVVLAEKSNLTEEFIDNYELIKEFSFDSERKRMSVIVFDKKEKKYYSFVKGAADLLLNLSDKLFENEKERKIKEEDKKIIKEQIEKYAKNSLRVLGFAYKEIKEADIEEIKKAESNLVFVGLVGMIDPARDEVKDSILKCKKAGIKVMMITGDHPLTAEAIGKNIGLIEKNDIILTGEELDKLSEKELLEKIENIRIVARAMPIQKLKIVEALQKKGHIVAMTGDGVNDAPALKKADIGVAMGITGTDVSKSVAKTVLVDDNFSTIVNAIETGRNIYDSLIRSARFFLSCNSGEIFTIIISLLLYFPLPMTPLQILIMNLLTDNFPAVGLGFEKAEENIMSRKPRDPKEKPLSNKMLVSIVVFGIIMAIGTIYLFSLYKDKDLTKAKTIAFTTLVMFQMWAVISSRTLSPDIKHFNLFSNLWLLGGIIAAVSFHVAILYIPFLQSVFNTVALNLYEWAIILLVSSSGFVIMEISKFFTKPT